MSTVRNIFAIAKGKKDPGEAAVSVIIDAGTDAGESYLIAFGGSVLKGTIQNAKSGVARSLSKTNLPAVIITTAIETGKTLTKFAKGEIDGTECLVELGEKGTGMAASALGRTLGGIAATAALGKYFEVVFGSLGTIAIPIPVVGTMIGSMVGYALSALCYGQLVSALTGAKLAREERIRIEAECAEAITMIRQCRAEMERAISPYLIEHIETF
jgi:hypothetical protein